MMKTILKMAVSWALVAQVAAAAPTNESLTLGISQEFENLNPLISNMVATTMIQETVIRGLVAMDPKGKYYPSLVKSIPTLENGGAKIVGEGKDRRILATWEMKEDAVWGDGKPVTGHDFEFTWKVALKDTVSVPDRDTYSNIAKIEVDKKNPKKFVIHHTEARWDFNRVLTVAVLPKHLEEPVFKKYGNSPEGYDKNSLYNLKPTNPGLYNGPYLVKEIKLGSHVVVERNPKFYGKQANIKKIIFKLIPNTATLEANLRSGTIDMISTLGFTFDQAVAFEKKVEEEKLPYNVVFNASMTYEHIDFNLDNPFLKDVQVRKAMIHAIDRQELVDFLFAGRLSPALHNITPIDPWYTDDPKKIVIYKSSKRKARSLLEKAGWKLGKDDYRYKDGKKLKFVLMTTSGNKSRELVQSYLKDQWKKVGIDIEIKNQPARVYFGETTRMRKFTGLAMYAWVSSPESTPKATFHSEMIPSKENGYSGQNQMGWVNKDVDKLLAELDAEFDAEKRKDIVAKILYHYTNDAPVIPLYYRAEMAVLPVGMEGVQLTSHQDSFTNHVEHWNVKTKVSKK